MKFTRVKIIGKGSFGVVYLAHCSTDSTLPHIAIKSSTLKRSSSLRKEKRVLENLEGCPHVITYLTYGETPKIYNIFLEFASGGTLSNLIKTRGGQLAEPEVQDYTRMLLKALCVIHKKGYVHCDLKPDNILVVPLPEGKNILKIADFGLAKEPGEEKECRDGCVNRFRGTPVYMSPDSYLTGVIDSALDVWSLGCVVVEMVSGKRAMKWLGGDRKDWKSGFAFVMQRPFVPVNMSSSGQDFVMKCFEISPEKRWTAEMLLKHPFVVETLTSSVPVMSSSASSTSSMSSALLPPHLLMKRWSKEI